MGYQMLHVRLDGYESLLGNVKKILSEGKERAQFTVELERVRTYWEAGGVLKAHLQDRDTQYGDQVLEKLSVDVGLSVSIVYDMVRLRERFVNFPTWGKLGWSHYRRLLPVDSDAVLRSYLREAEKKAWSVRDLDVALKADPRVKGTTASEEPGAEGGKPARPAMVAEKRLSAKRGDLYLYRVKQKKKRLVLDLGFKKFRRLPKRVAKGFKPGDTVRSIQDDGVRGGYRYEMAEKRKRFYSYRAEVEKIIDGDTVWATVDLGFAYLTDEKLRLRAIDTPELKTEGGKRAKDYLEGILEEADEFVVTTTKVDLYDRYLTDIFVAPGEADMQAVANEGRYINRELIEEGFARRWV